MNVQPRIIGTRSDGSLLGEVDGTLYAGTKRQVSYDEVERTVEETDDAFRFIFHVNGYQLGGETLAKQYEVTNEDGSKTTAARTLPEHKPEKTYRDVDIVQQDGSVIAGTREVKLTVIDWSVL